MSKYIFAAATILVGWLIHVVLVTSYLKLFASSHSIAFRAVYALELSLTLSLAWGIYLSQANQPVSNAVMIASTIGFLAIIDTVLSLTVPSVRASFDVWHFVFAYSLLAVCLVGLSKFHPAA